MRTMPALIGTMAVAGISMCVAVSHAQQQPGTAPVQAPVQAQPPAAVPAQPAAVPAQPAAPAATAPAFTPEQKEVVAAVEAFTKIYNTADAKALAEAFTDDVVLTDPEGDETRGRAAVA